MYIYTPCPKILSRIKNAKLKKGLDEKEGYKLATQSSALYSDVISVLCAYEQVKFVTLFRPEKIKVGNTYLDVSFFEESEYSCNIAEEV
jgi:hypothetical protein